MKIRDGVGNPKQQGGKEGRMMASRIITKKDCKICDFVLICIVSKVFEALPTCKEIKFDKDGCPASWECYTKP